MASVLDAIIDGASDPGVRTVDLLRRTIAAAHRLRASTVRGWAQAELAGYRGSDASTLPVYRRAMKTGVRAQWSGPFGSSASTILTPVDAPEDFGRLFEIDFREPIAELEAIVELQGDSGMTFAWPAAALSWWNELIAEGRATHVQGMVLFSAHTIAPRQAIVGVVDSVRTEIMQLALDLQDTADTAGEPGGPTVNDPDVAQVVNNFITNVYGGSPHVAQALSIEQTVVITGDVGSLTRAAQTLGLDGADLTDYVEAALAARGEPDRRSLKKFLVKVRDGAVVLGSGVATNIAADQLLAWAVSFLGG